MPVYFCWLCEQRVPEDAPVDKHYETGAIVRFCGQEHKNEYQELDSLLAKVRGGNHEMLDSLIAAVALQPSKHVVVSGDTLSGIAAASGDSLAAVEAANPQIADPNLIFVGQTVNVPVVSGAVVSTVAPKHASAAPPDTGPSGPSPQGRHAAPVPMTSASAAAGLSSSNLANVPGVPTAFAACVAFRESTNGTNPASFTNGVPNVYGIIPASGINVVGQPLSVQKAAFAKLFAQFGTAPWQPSDGCTING